MIKGILKSIKQTIIGYKIDNMTSLAAMMKSSQVIINRLKPKHLPRFSIVSKPITSLIDSSSRCYTMFKCHMTRNVMLHTTCAYVDQVLEVVV